MLVELSSVEPRYQAPVRVAPVHQTGDAQRLVANGRKDDPTYARRTYAWVRGPYRAPFVRQSQRQSYGSVPLTASGDGEGWASRASMAASVSS
jgi:hypothetical protein